MDGRQGLRAGRHRAAKALYTVGVVRIGLMALAVVAMAGWLLYELVRPPAPVAEPAPAVTAPPAPAVAAPTAPAVAVAPEATPAPPVAVAPPALPAPPTAPPPVAAAPEPTELEAAEVDTSEWTQEARVEHYVHAVAADENDLAALKLLEREDRTGEYRARIRALEAKLERDRAALERARREP